MKVAVAGANTGVGRHIVESILARKTHSVLVLSRRHDAELKSLGAEVKVVDFVSVESLTSALTGVHTVINAIGVAEPSTFLSTELALIHASENAGVKRFVANGWSAKDGGPDEILTMYKLKQPSLDALRKSKLEWSFPEIGLFLNYFVMGTPGAGHLKHHILIIDVGGGKANLPGDGNKKMVLTTIQDVGEFIARALDVDHWPQHLRVVGNLISLNEIVALGEKARGKKFDVTYCSEQDSLDAIHPDASPLVNGLHEFNLAVLQGRFTFEPNFNDQVPMEFTKAQDFIQKWWGNSNQ